MGLYGPLLPPPPGGRCSRWWPPGCGREATPRHPNLKASRVSARVMWPSVPGTPPWPLLALPIPAISKGPYFLLPGFLKRPPGLLQSSTEATVKLLKCKLGDMTLLGPFPWLPKGPALFSSLSFLDHVPLPAHSPWSPSYSLICSVFWSLHFSLNPKSSGSPQGLLFPRKVASPSSRL